MKEIVIKIPDEMKEAFDNAESNELKGGFYDHGGVIASAIRNGKVLPKGHGKLKDTNKIINDGISKGFCDWYDEIKNAETLVEADKGDPE